MAALSLPFPSAPYPTPTLMYGPLGDGGVGGHAGIGDERTLFVGRRSVRDTWIAIWVMWLLWATLFLAKQALGPPRLTDVSRTERLAPVPSVIPPEVEAYDTSAPSVPVEPVRTSQAVSEARAPKNFLRQFRDNIAERIEKAHNLVRDLTLMLLLVVALNTFGLGSGVFVLIVSWTYLALAFLWAGLVMVIDFRIIDIVLGSIEMLLLLAMLIVAYSVGWRLI